MTVEDIMDELAGWDPACSVYAVDSAGQELELSCFLDSNRVSPVILVKSSEIQTTHYDDNDGSYPGP